MVNRPALPTLPSWLEEDLPGERFFREVGSWRMHGFTSGEGFPVVLVHGNPTWSYLYRKVAEELADDGIRCIAPDLVGLGFSDKPDRPELHTLENHARWLGRLVDEMAIDRFVLVGQDWGGPIGLRMAAERSDRLAGLVVLNTVVSPPKAGFRQTTFHRFARLPVVSTITFRGLGFPQIALHLAQGDRSSIRGCTAKAYRYPLRGWSRRVAPLALARMVPDSVDHPSIEPLERCRSLVESFRGPSAIVWGDRDPILGRVRSWVAKLLPDAPVTRTDAGHFLQEEVPAEIAQGIRKVIARV